MYTIGFTTKFYTLWDVTVDTFTDAYGRKGRRVAATFIKNVSMDEKAARAKYPDAPVDLSLRGHSSWTRTEWEPLPGDVFPCGKYMGQPIAECDDLGYLYWAVNTNMLCAERRDIAVSVLLGSGLYGEYDGVLMKMDRVNELLAEDATRDEIAAAIDVNGCVDLLRPVYHLFDCSGKMAYVVVPIDPENERMCIQLAESCGGEKTTPNMR